MNSLCPTCHIPQVHVLERDPTNSCILWSLLCYAVLTLPSITNVGFLTSTFLNVSMWCLDFSDACSRHRLFRNVTLPFFILLSVRFLTFAFPNVFSCCVNFSDIYSHHLLFPNSAFSFLMTQNIGFLTSAILNVSNCCLNLPNTCSYLRLPLIGIVHTLHYHAIQNIWTAIYPFP